MPEVEFYDFNSEARPDDQAKMDLSELLVKSDQGNTSLSRVGCSKLRHTICQIIPVFLDIIVKSAN